MIYPFYPFFLYDGGAGVMPIGLTTLRMLFERADTITSSDTASAVEDEPFTVVHAAEITGVTVLEAQIAWRRAARQARTTRDLPPGLKLVV